MTENVANNFAPHQFTAPGLGTLRRVLDKDTTTRDKIPLNGLGVKKGKPIRVSVMVKKEMEVEEYCTIFNYGTPGPQKYINPKYREIVAGKGVKTSPTLVILRQIRVQVGQENPPDVLIMEKWRHHWKPH